MVVHTQHLLNTESALPNSHFCNGKVGRFVRILATVYRERDASSATRGHPTVDAVDQLPLISTRSAVGATDGRPVRHRRYCVNFGSHPSAVIDQASAAMVMPMEPIAASSLQDAPLGAARVPGE